MVERVGVRALQQHASKVVHAVSEGATVEVTDRGRLVARMVPADADPIDVLVESGQARRATRRLRELAPPLRSDRSGDRKALTDLLQESREDER